MLIHLSDVITNESKTLEQSVEFTADVIRFQQGEFRILDKTPFLFKVVNTGNKVLKLEGTGRIVVAIPCARCLEDVPTEFPLTIERKLDMKQSEEDRIKDLDESNYITGVDLDVDRLIYNEILTQWPLKVLCKEDCKGICSQCGTNLNHGTCSCEEEPKDPRMAAISDIFSKFKEV